MESNSVGTMPSSGLVSAHGYGKQAKDYAVGETITFVASRHGGFQVYFDEFILHPQDRLIVEVKSVKAVKPQEFVEA